MLIDSVDNNTDVQCDCAGVDNCELVSKQNVLSINLFSKIAWKVYHDLHELCIIWQLAI